MSYPDPADWVDVEGKALELSYDDEQNTTRHRSHYTLNEETGVLEPANPPEVEEADSVEVVDL